MVKQTRGISEIAALAALVLCFSSCNGPEEEIPLSPRTMFTTGARFLDDARTLAVKGSIEFQADDSFESGSFNLFLNGHDSLSFLIEGPFKVDLFRIVVLPDKAFLDSRDKAQRLVLEPDEKFQVPEYGIEKLSPSVLGIYIIPQYFLMPADSPGPSTRLVSRRRDEEYIAASSGDGRLVSLTSAESDLLAVYSRARSLPGGFYPSEVEISDRAGKWRISLEIEKVRENVRLPEKIWVLD